MSLPPAACVPIAALASFHPTSCVNCGCAQFVPSPTAIDVVPGLRFTSTKTWKKSLVLGVQILLLGHKQHGSTVLLTAGWVADAFDQGAQYYPGIFVFTFNVKLILMFGGHYLVNNSFVWGNLFSCWRLYSFCQEYCYSVYWKWNVFTSSCKMVLLGKAEQT